MVDCHAAWLNFLAEFNAHYFAHKKAIKNIATLDVLFSLVQVAKQDGYCKYVLLRLTFSITKVYTKIIQTVFSVGTW